ncbi:hypothetical protein FRB99_001888 [Tulasnella sp. 403]|nr:hypothetical protein FRB99_001888 [Tulasnella sp. 403]
MPEISMLSLGQTTGQHAHLLASPVFHSTNGVDPYRFAENWTSTSNGEAKKEFLGVVAPHANRFCSVAISTPEIDVVTAFLSSPYCSLNRFHVETFPSNTTIGMNPVTAGNLVDLSISMCSLDWSISRFPNLRRLRLLCCYAPAQVIDIICAMPKLQNLILNIFPDPEDVIKPTSIASLPELEKVYLYTAPFTCTLSVLEAMSIPPTSIITVQIPGPENIPEVVDRVVQHARRQESSPNSRIYLGMARRSFSLALGFCEIWTKSPQPLGDIDDIVYQACEDIFKNVPQHIRDLPTQLLLDSLSAEQTDLFLPLVDRYYNINELIVQALPCSPLVELLLKPQPTSPDGSRWVCPRLTSVCVSSRLRWPLGFNSLQTLAESRQSQEEAGVVPLQKVTVHGRRNIHRSTVDALKSLVSEVDIPDHCIYGVEDDDLVSDWEEEEEEASEASDPDEGEEDEEGEDDNDDEYYEDGDGDEEEGEEE